MSRRPSLLAVLLLTLVPVAQADDAVVGTGTPGSCTDAALDDAILQVFFGGSQGGRITFDCGTAPVSVALASSKLFDAGIDTEIDGGGLITLDAGNQRRHFDIRGVGTTLTLRGLTLRSGQASDFGGAANVGAGAGLFVHDCRFFNNGAAFGGGAIAGEPGSSLIVLDSRFDLNSAASGGAIAKTGQLTIANSQFAENTAADQGGAVQWWFPIGGDIVASTFTGNGAANGGAILVRGGTARLDGVRLDANNATGGGGGLFAYDDAQIEVLRSTIVNNLANGGGGGVRLEGFQDPDFDLGNIVPATPGTGAVIVDSLIATNVASGGGGIYVFGPLAEGRYATLELRDSEVRGNSAAFDGGGIVNRGRATLRRVRILDNVAAGSDGSFGAGDGGGLHLQAFAGPAASATLIEQSLIRGNRARDTGGGIDSFGHDLTFREASLVENFARDGGGAHIYAPDPLNLSQAAFVRNFATVDGGGLNLSQKAPVQLAFMSFADNQAGSGVGRDIHMSSEFTNTGQQLEVALLHVTAANPAAHPGSSLHADRAAGFRLRNSIVYGGGTDCTGPVASDGGNLLGSVSCAPTATDLQPASLTVLGLGPLVELPYQGFYLPVATSPAVDFPLCVAGTSVDQRNAALNRDGDGDGFLRCDAGAIERQSVDEMPPASSGALFGDGFESS
jgi:predicted outer membrane repeat protein